MNTAKHLSIVLILLFFGLSGIAVSQALDLTESLSEMESRDIDRQLVSEEADQEETPEVEEKPSVTIFDIIDRQALAEEIVFDPGKDRDIFVLPWVVDAVNATRLLVLGEGHLEANQFDEAIAVFTRLVSQYEGMDQALLAKEKIEQARERKARYALDQARRLEALRREREREQMLEETFIPVDVKRHITAVIWDNTDSFLLYRDDSLRKGQAIPDYPEIMIHNFQRPYMYFLIDEETLSYEFRSDIF